MKKLTFLTFLFSFFSFSQAQATDWLNPYVGIDYAYTDAGYGNYPSKAFDDKTDSYILSSGIKVLP